jgi:peptidoglycan/xylan/chitin deacetylase (PgdA/CDA1 family)
MSTFRVCLTHDVDRVYKTFQYVTHDLRRARWRNLHTLFTGESPYWGFDRLRRIEERLGVRSTFFFLEETMPVRWMSPSDWKLGLGRYRFSDPRVKQVIRDLDRDGWDIGLHGSYFSYRREDLLWREKERLESVLGRSVSGIRQHYLNLDVPGTWLLQRNVGFGYDASYGKKDSIGFLDGAYHPFVHQESGLIVIPLALMECYLFAQAGHRVEDAWRLSLDLIDEAECRGALFTILWHQRMFNEQEFPGYAPIYERIVRECQARGARFVTCQAIYEQMLASVGTASPLTDAPADPIAITECSQSEA